METQFAVKTEVKIGIDKIQNLLCSAFEGGSNYWYYIHKFKKPTSMPNKEKGEKHIFRHIDYPTNPGGYVEVIDLYAECEMDNAPPHDVFGRSDFKGWKPKTKPVRLDLKRLEKGLKIMAEKYPRHFADVMNENDDACTGDVFLQCCVFGDVIYG